jgi:hypothetical protein
MFVPLALKYRFPWLTTMPGPAPLTIVARSFGVPPASVIAFTPSLLSVQ